MHPAFSVLVFTVISGAGYGLIFLMVLGHLSGVEVLQQRPLLLSGGILALIMISVGLMASTLHLANPKNAWRAFSRFRTSWLSREAVFAIVFYPFSLCYLLGVWLEGAQLSSGFLVAGAISALLALITLFCTSMIYASLKTIRQWHNALTPVNYITLGLMSGALLLCAVQAIVNQELAGDLQYLATVLVIMGACVKVIYFFWIGKPSGSSIQTATGFTQASVRLMDQGHSSNGFINNEFGYSVAADKLLRIRLASLTLAFALPLLLLWTGGVLLMVLAVIATLAGLLAERWLFFAEARHVVRLFHGDQRT